MSVAMCDADDVIAPGWVRAMGTALAEHEFVTGPLDVDRLNPAWVAGTRGRAIESRPGQLPRRVPVRPQLQPRRPQGGGHPAGGFDERLHTGEDIELSFRLWQANVVLTYVPEALVHYRYRRTMGELWNQSRAHARVSPWLEQRGPGRGRRACPRTTSGAAGSGSAATSAGSPRRRAGPSGSRWPAAASAASRVTGATGEGT